MNIIEYNKLLDEETTLKKEKKELIEQLENVNSQLIEVEDQEKETQKKIKNAEVKLSELQSKVEETRETKNKIAEEQRIEKLSPGDLEGLQAELSNISKRCAESHLALEKADECYHILADIFNNSKWEEVFEKISQLTFNNRGLKIKEKELQAKLAELKKTKETAESGLGTTEEEITYLRSRHGTAMTLFQKSEQEMQELGMRRKQFIKGTTAATSKLNQLEAEQKKKKWGSEIAGLKKKLKAQNEKLNTERKKRLKVENQLAVLKEEIAQKEKALEAIEKKEIPELKEISSELIQLFEESNVSYLAVKDSISPDIVKNNLNGLAKFIKDQCPVN